VQVKLKQYYQTDPGWAWLNGLWWKTDADPTFTQAAYKARAHCNQLGGMKIPIGLEKGKVKREVDATKKKGKMQERGECKKIRKPRSKKLKMESREKSQGGNKG